MSPANPIPDAPCGSGPVHRARGLPARLLQLLVLALLLAATSRVAAAEAAAAPLVIGHRTVHVFRAELGAFTAAERAEAARRRVEAAFGANGEGWTSVRPEGPGVMVELDGRPLFLVVAADAEPGSGDSADRMANAASRALQAAWRDAREHRDPRATAAAVVKVVAGAVVLLLALTLVWALSRRLRDAVTARLAVPADGLPGRSLASRLSPLSLGFASRGCVLLAWLASLLLCFVFVAFALEQFAATRALGQGLLQSFAALLLQALTAMAQAVPGLFVAVLIFLAAWVCTQLSSELFEHVASGRLKVGMLDAHTAPATRRIVNALLWLFALAMAYPYLPGAQTEAFKGLSVILGIMVSIGASGLVGQVASGVILVYTRALSLGEMVRIQDCEGTVTEIGLFVTRLRNGLGTEFALPNALVLGNVTRNLSRVGPAGGCVVETAVTIGYDTPWRQVHALLIEAARTVAEVSREPAPYVVQAALQDYYVAYRLIVHIAAHDAATRARVASALNAAIQDQFNRHGVQIMSPSYYDDPRTPKLVPEARWYTAPAVRPPGPAPDRPSAPHDAAP